jgi:hypothetical protein
MPIPFDLGFTGAHRPVRDPRVERLGANSWKQALDEQGRFSYAGDDENPRALPYRTLWSMREKMQDNLSALRDDGTTLHPQAMFFAFCHDRVEMPDEWVIAVPRDDLWWLTAPGDLLLLSDGVTDHFATALNASAQTGRMQIVDEWPQRSFLRDGHNEEEVSARIEPFFAGVFESVLPGKQVIDIARDEFLRVAVGLVSIDTPALIERYLDHRPELREDAAGLFRFGCQLMSAHRDEVVRFAAPYFVRAERYAQAGGDAVLAARAATWSYAAHSIGALVQAWTGHPFAVWPFQAALQDLGERYGEARLLDTLDVEVLCRLGNAALNHGQPERAFGYLDLAVARDPFHDAAYGMRARARMQRNEPQAQVDDASEALARNAAYIELRRAEIAALDPRDRHGRIDIERRIGGLQQRRAEELATRAHGLRALGHIEQAQADEAEARELEAREPVP